jgi:transcriptional regulator
MYRKTSFNVDDVGTLAAFIAQHAFATVMTAVGGDGLTASHVPLVLSRHGTALTLTGHLARANDHWRHFDGQTPALVIFQGPHAYVSPTWYTSAPAVPTWNYAVVHARGKPRVLDDAQLLRSVRAMVEKYEGGRAPRWRMEDTPPVFQAGLLEAIVGFELVVESIEGKFKLSQNRSRADREGTVAGLEANGDEAALLASFMRAHSF